MSDPAPCKVHKRGAGPNLPPHSDRAPGCLLTLSPGQAALTCEKEAVVAVFGSAYGTFSGRRGPVPENRIEMPAAWKAVEEKGKVKHWQVYTDWTEGCKIIERDKAPDQL